MGGGLRGAEGAQGASQGGGQAGVCAMQHAPQRPPAPSQVDPHQAVAFHTAMFSRPAEFTVVLTGNFPIEQVCARAGGDGGWGAEFTVVLTGNFPIEQVCACRG